MEAAREYINPSPELDMVAQLESAVNELYQAVNGSPLPQRKRISLHKRCLGLKLESRELFELQINCEMVPVVLSTLHELGIEPAGCQKLLASLEELPSLIAVDKQSPEEQQKRLARIEELRAIIETLESKLKSLIQEDPKKRILLAPLLKDFQVIRAQLKKRIHEQPIASLEKLKEFKKTCASLKKQYKAQVEIEWRVLQVQSLCEQIISRKPARERCQLLGHHITLFLRSEELPAIVEYYRDILDDLAALREEITHVQKSPKSSKEITKSPRIFSLFQNLFKNTRNN